MPNIDSKKRNSSEERSNKYGEILKKFADMMIKIIEKGSGSNWKKGWLGSNGSTQGVPQNISGRPYSGGNAFFLMFQTADKGYQTPVYMTFKQAKDQQVHVKSGEKSVPVFKWGLSIRDEKGKKVSEETYNAMTEEERAKMAVRPFPRMFYVFNIDQTNMQEVNKKKYDAIVERFKVPEQGAKDVEGMYVNEALDRMFETKAWHTPIQYDKPSDSAFYRPSEDIIVLPMKEQFKTGQTPQDIYRDGMEFYSTALHEMAHSTGHESRLNRQFGVRTTDSYAHEELIAEMTSALVGSSMGFDKKILENNGNYLSGWLSQLKEKPETITTIMSDVGKASDMIFEKIDEQRIALNQTPLRMGNLEGFDEELAAEKVRGKTLYDLTEQYNRINDQYPSSVDDDRTRQIAKRIKQAEQIMTAYNANITAAYGKDFPYSEAAMTTVIPHAVYSIDNQQGSEEQVAASSENEENSLEHPNAENQKDNTIKTEPTHIEAEQNTLSKEVADDKISETQEEKRIVPDRNPLAAADDYDDFSEALAEGLGIEEKKVEPEENVSLSEDSNPQTNLADITKNIMETNHVSKDVAEKKAVPIVHEQQTVANEKKQKAEQAKQDAIKKAEEARKAEEERRREVEEQRHREEENKDGGQGTKLLLHAALLLGALETAKGNKGIWMNKAGKSNAEFLWAKTPITPYNNLMMNLQSDQKGYRTNVYAYFDELKNAGDHVRTNEKSLPFNWTRWDYQNMATKEVITKDEYNKLPEEEKSLYVKHNTRQTQQLFNIDQTSITGKEMYRDLLKEAGAKHEELSERGVLSMMSYANKIKANHPTAIVLTKADNLYEVYGNDATRASKILGTPVSYKEVEGKKVKFTGFPLDRLTTYLPKFTQAKQWVVTVDNLDSAELIRNVVNEKDVLNKAHSIAQNVARSAGMAYERVMVLQDAEYDKDRDKIIASGIVDKDGGNSRQAAIAQANDIYRAVVAATGSEQRLDRLGRNNFLPKDDAKYETFVQDLSAGVLMARQGLPAFLSKESMQNIDYWQREIKENPKLIGLLEKDVNNAVETIDKHIQQEVVKYEDIRKDLPPKDLAISERQFQVSTDLAKLPDIDSKEVVIVRDKAKGTADVILPEGASLDENIEISGIRKDRIKIALEREGITDIKFYNAGGALGLKEPNDYYKDKTISVERLKQYEFNRHREVDVQSVIAATAIPKINIFTHIRDEKGQYAFFFKPENEPSFSVYPNDAHKKAYFDVRGTDKQQEIHNALAQKYYSVAKTHPEIKVELIMPKIPNVDLTKIERPTITKDKDNPEKKYVTASIDGEFMKQEISKAQWEKMWIADDMSAYKRAVAAVTFAPFLKEVVEKNSTIAQADAQTVRQDDHVPSVEASEAKGSDENIEDIKAEKEEEAVSEEKSEEISTPVRQVRPGLR